jgi:DNA polymerase III epsilon subunit-like protein
MRLIVVDTETGGLDPELHSILSLGAVIWDNGDIVDEFYTVIKEDLVATTPGAFKVNRMTSEEIDGGRTPQDAMIAFRMWLMKNGMAGPRQSLAGHNVSFDIGFMRRLYRQANQKWEFSHRTLDTQIGALLLNLAGKLDTKNTGLDALTKHYGIKVREGGESGRHNALEDARATAYLLTKLVEEMK